MTDWTKLPGGFDLSHWNGEVDWDKLAAEQPAFVIIKATDGMGVDPTFERNRRAALDRKLRLLWYPFLEPADSDRAIEHAIRVVADRTLPPMLDWEKAGVKHAVVERWQDLCEAESRAGLVYYGLNAPDLVTARIAHWLRVLPQYPGSPTAPPRLPPWDGRPRTDWSRQWFIWQWSEKGRDPAFRGDVDLDRLACSVETFDAWYRTGVLPAASVTMPPSRLTISRALRFNSTGDEVTMLQHRLVELGVPGVDTAGVFDTRTRRAVVSFQQLHRLGADGVVGPKTLAALNDA
jgi:lysozyme